MSSKRDWTEDLPELFEGYTEAAPEGLWEAVEAGSGAAAGRRRKAGWWYAGGALLAAAAVVAVDLDHALVEHIQTNEVHDKGDGGCNEQEPLILFKFAPLFIASPFALCASSPICIFTSICISALNYN